MNAVLEQNRTAVSTSTPPAAAAPAPAQAAAPPQAASTAWAGDRIALAVWLTGATIMAFLLLRDLVFAFVPR
jgi:hypothetical protein